MSTTICSRYYRGNSEALGWALDSVAGPVLFVSSAVFLATALLNLAKDAAGCSDIDTRYCTNRIYGFRPSSLLTSYSTIVGLVSATTLPVIGAVLDHTSHRKLVGLITALLMCVIAHCQALLNERNWFYIAISQLILATLGWIHALTLYAYLPELSSDSTELASWTASFHAIAYISMVLFLGYAVGLISLLGYRDNDILSSRTATISSSTIATICYSLSWIKFMKPRPAFRPIPEGSNLFTVGFKKNWKTFKLLKLKYRGLMWFFAASSVVEAASQSLATISITYMTYTLDMSAIQNGIAIIILFLFSSIGALCGKLSLKIATPIRSYQYALTITILNCILATIILTGPGQSIRAYFIACFWGVGAGWRSVVEKFATCRIIPKGQDAELMGLYLFSGQILVWLPTLIFTFMNEADVNPR
jgi:MFS-type transporter involved in bile tolerance (Atg22 family)